MANRKPEEPSHTCPKCGLGPFTARGLKTHNCANRQAHPEHYNVPPAKSVALEVLPRVDKEVGACVKQLRKQMDSIARRSRDLIYEVVAAGVYLLKLRQLHLAQGFRSDLPQLENDSSTCGNVSASPDDESGFYDVLKHEFCRTDIEDETELKKHVAAVQRTARNYMNAARNAGLTADHTLADVQRLKKQHALDDKNATELYRLKEKEPEQNGGDGNEPPNLNADTLQALSEACEQIRALRDSFSAQEFDAACVTLRDTYSAFTGEDMVHHEHGEETVKHRGGKRK